MLRGGEHLHGREGVDRGAIANFSKVDVFVGAMRDRQHAGSVGKGGYALGSVEASLKQTWAHLESWCFAGYGGDTSRQCASQFSAFARGGGAALL